MKATYGDINLDNALVILQSGVLDENLNWVPAAEEASCSRSRTKRSPLLASGIGAAFAGFLAALAELAGSSPSPF